MAGTLPQTHSPIIFFLLVIGCHRDCSENLRLLRTPAPATDVVVSVGAGHEKGAVVCSTASLLPLLPRSHLRPLTLSGEIGKRPGSRASPRLAPPNRYYEPLQGVAPSSGVDG